MSRGLKMFAATVDMGVVKRTLVYVASGSASALVSFLLLPVLTKYLSPADYGVVEIFTTLASCMTGIVLIGGNTILAKEYFDTVGLSRQKLIGSILGLTLASTAVLFLLLLVIGALGFPFHSLLKIRPSVLYAAVLFSLAIAIITLFTTLLQVEKRAAQYAYFVNSKTIIEISASLVLIITFGLRWQGRIAGMLIGAAAYTIVSLGLFFRRSVRLYFSKTEYRRLVLLGLPLVAAHVSVWAYGMVDRVMISNLFDLTTTGLYSVGFRFASVVSMVESAFSIAWMPFFFENIRLRSPRTDARIVRLTYTYIAGLLVFAVAFGIAAQWLLPAMVDNRFDEARHFTLLLCLGFGLCGSWKMFNGYLIAAGRTRLYGTITSVTAVLHVALTWWLLRRIGPMGAAWATLLTYAFATTATIIAAHRIYPMPWLAAFRRGTGI